ncbi:endonuclease [Ralstonia phage DU_RP_I]|uniref:Putative restriction endonuclease n=1 Tax=Ralstonia phage DU_RP_I TaxID=2041493 RepID=A0A2D2W4Y4_9CAUD|nr:endonuclease [Ralstonia phage DU_RP_I]ATS93365.1 putative restriction endonuclease [Ralstonia phage DU_RP_I]
MALVPEENWWPSFVKANKKVCKVCQGAASEASRKKTYADNLPKTMVRNARSRARVLGVPFALSEGDITIPTHCPVLGIPLFHSTGHFTGNSPSLDRLIPEKGYVPGNVAVISQKANFIKSNASVEEVEAIARWMRSVG